MFDADATAVPRSCRRTVFDHNALPVGAAVDHEARTREVAGRPTRR
jgi:hypothetical protein